MNAEERYHGYKHVFEYDNARYQTNGIHYYFLKKDLNLQTDKKPCSSRNREITVLNIYSHHYCTLKSVQV